MRKAYIYYAYFQPRPSWDLLAIMYATFGLGDLFEFGNNYGHNHIEPNGTNRWVWDSQSHNQFFLRLKARNETAAAEVDRLLLQGAQASAGLSESKKPHGKLPEAHHGDL